MKEDLVKNAKDILGNSDKLSEFADLNRITSDAAKQLLERLLEKPEMADEFKEYIFSKDRSEDFKGYTAGEEKGYQRGHESGFAKGAALGVLGTLTLASLVFLAGRE
ncbi:hypothetical protein QX249_27955 [Vibrio parahaemolyticus]|uniref:Uncharacterized protein n=1 Tax=Vibrio parahaemolyticus TaxID=670 RepID=A0AAW8Q7J5_VIBPH|nr:hypothetical protein [Vibrio parahaemolyticus]MDS1824456.1 hypothetical protein [Vibrio parahaemolyticus]TOI99609.1 hypothetical protein CGI47_25230 [Vibrio parahaemolyticus]HCH6458127.1 hypothetical protein [Vibrio parahaemolyticus]